MNKMRYRLFSTAASLAAAVAIALCELLHPCFHPGARDSGGTGDSGTVFVAHHDGCAVSDDGACCPVCAGAFLFCAAGADIVIPEMAYPEAFFPEAQSVSVSHVIVIFSRGPPCRNTFSFLRT